MNPQMEKIFRLREKITEQAKAIRDLRSRISSLRDSLFNFGEHQSPCPWAHFSGGRPTENGGYESCFGGKWYPRDEDPPCTCGLLAAQNGDEEETS